LEGLWILKKKLKQGYFGSDICPKVVILDPHISVHTPKMVMAVYGY
jgi:hypothetical protein